MEKDIVFYQREDGREPFPEWAYSLEDKVTQHRIWARIRRVKQGNLGDHKRFDGIIELRLDFGKGYRIYCGEDGERIIIMLAGGDKSSQEKDIRQALEYWRDYHEQKKI